MPKFRSTLGRISEVLIVVCSAVILIRNLRWWGVAMSAFIIMIWCVGWWIEWYGKRIRAQVARNNELIDQSRKRSEALEAVRKQVEKDPRGTFEKISKADQN